MEKRLFVLVYEEPTLRASFGSEYKSFLAKVPRWIPRFTPWRSHPERERVSKRLVFETQLWHRSKNAC
jgi:hypothetical protein